MPPQPAPPACCPNPAPFSPPLPRLLQGYFYYIFGFLFLVAILTLVITVEVSIVCT